MDHFALVVRENLEFDMVRVFDVFLDVNPGIAEGLLRFGARGVIAFDEGNVVVGHAHAAPAAAGDGLDHHGIADAFGNDEGVLLVLHRAFRTGRDRDPGFLREIAADGLVFQRVHRPGTRTDEPDVAAFANVRKMGVLGQEPVAGVDGIDIRDLGRADDAVNAQVTLVAGGLADTDRFIRKLHVHRVGIHVRIDRHRADVQLLASADDADGNFSAIGYQDFFKHGIGKDFRRHLINSGRWRGQRFGPAARREEGASPQWGCDRRTTKWPAQRSAAWVVFSSVISFILAHSSFVKTPLRVFMRWLLVLTGPGRRMGVAPNSRQWNCHVGRILNKGWPNSTGFAFSTQTCVMMPLASALISFMTFIASMMQTTVSGLTSLPIST